MKILCKDAHQQELEKEFKNYQTLDIVLVEKGIEYQGFHYSFEIRNLKQVKKELDILLLEDKQLIGYINEKMFIINPLDIVYIEGFSKESYIYTLENEYKSKYKVYELEELLTSHCFIRVSKSIIINIQYIDYLIPEVNMRYAIYMKNNITIILSRSYLKTFKERLNMR